MIKKLAYQISLGTLQAGVLYPFVAIAVLKVFYYPDVQMRIEGKMLLQTAGLHVIIVTLATALGCLLMACCSKRARKSWRFKIIWAVAVILFLLLPAAI